MDHEDWEEICTRCGKCCYEKVDLGAGEICYTEEPCKYLDTETNLCTVYERRQEVEPDCIGLTEDLVRVLHWLPEDCAYVRHMRFKDAVAVVEAAGKTDRSNRRSRRKR